LRTSLDNWRFAAIADKPDSFVKSVSENATRPKARRVSIKASATPIWRGSLTLLGCFSIYTKHGQTVHCANNNFTLKRSAFSRTTTRQLCCYIEKLVSILTRYQVLFVIKLATREVKIDGLVPSKSWVLQVGRHVVDPWTGFLRASRLLIHERSTLFSEQFRQM
jgi:hypothetical protein